MRQHINRRANQNPMGNWGNWDWFRARDAMIFGAGALLSLAASRVAPPAAVANAVCDALAPFGVEVNATPIRPEQIVRFLRSR